MQLTFPRYGPQRKENKAGGLPNAGIPSPKCGDLLSLGNAVAVCERRLGRGRRREDERMHAVDILRSGTTVTFSGALAPSGFYPITNE